MQPEVMKYLHHKYKQRRFENICWICVRRTYVHYKIKIRYYNTLFYGVCNIFESSFRNLIEQDLDLLCTCFTKVDTIKKKILNELAFQINLLTTYQTCIFWISLHKIKNHTEFNLPITQINHMFNNVIICFVGCFTFDCGKDLELCGLKGITLTKGLKHDKHILLLANTLN